MSGLFGGSTTKLMREQMAAARRNQQMANEGAARERQKAERGVGPGRQIGRALLIGRIGKGAISTSEAARPVVTTTGGGGSGGPRGG
jgi:hypothetical protein